MPNPKSLEMQPSKSPYRARRHVKRALPLSLAVALRSVRRRLALCLMLLGAAACTTRDAGAVREDSPDRTDVQPAVQAPAVAPASGASGTGAGAASPSRHTSAAVADTLLASADVYAGWRSFNINCQSCHGLNAVASEAAPDLLNSVRKGGTLTHAQFREVVRKGRMAKGMPSWGALLDSAQIDRIYAYLVARSSGALGAGQPSVGGE